MKREKKIRGKPRSTWQNTLLVCKCKSIRIGDQEHNKMVQRISSGIPIPIESSILMKDVSPQFNEIVVARTHEVLIGEKS